MTEFNIRTDSVDVEQIMRQIRARIKDKRGVDYTEQQIQELANVKLERFLDPKGVRSDLIDQFRRAQGANVEPVELFEAPNYAFEDTTLYETHRGILTFIRRLLRPILKLFFNPNQIVHALHRQSEINEIYAQQFNVWRLKMRDRERDRSELDALHYEVIHNLVLELTRVSIETKNMKMRLESLSSRMDFDERRARALEGVVQYKPGTGPAREPQQQAPPRVSEPPRQQPQRQSRPPYQPPPRPQVAAQPQPHQSADAGTPGAEISAQPAEAASSDAPMTGAQVAADGSATPGTARRRRRRRRGRRGGRGRALGANEMPAAGAAAGSGLMPGADPAHLAQGDFYDTDANGESGSGADSEADDGPEPSEQ